jgi:hypothetical protein
VIDGGQSGLGVTSTSRRAWSALQLERAQRIAPRLHIYDGRLAGYRQRLKPLAGHLNVLVLDVRPKVILPADHRPPAGCYSSASRIRPAAISATRRSTCAGSPGRGEHGSWGHEFDRRTRRWSTPERCGSLTRPVEGCAQAMQSTTKGER